MRGKLICASCGAATQELYQRASDEKWACFGCLDDSDVDRYPGWREREAQQVKQVRQVL